MTLNDGHSHPGRSASGFLVLPLVIALTAGCASPGYLTDRGRDAADVFTLSVGTGIGAKARVGPVGTGLLYDSPVAGLRGGAWLTGSRYANPGRPVPINHDLQMLVAGEETFLGSTLVQERGKAFSAGMICAVNVPSKSDLSKKARAVNRTLRRPPPQAVRHSPGHYLSQIEVVAGVGVSLRLGFNPAEFLDLILGFAGHDLFGDDLERLLESEPVPVPSDGKAPS